MEKLGLSRSTIFGLTTLTALFLSGVAFISTRIPSIPAIGLYILVGVLFIFVSLWLGKVEVD
jgi:hypothetical protein